MTVEKKQKRHLLVKVITISRDKDEVFGWMSELDRILDSFQVCFAFFS
jgi:hypothetical protein